MYHLYVAFGLHWTYGPHKSHPSTEHSSGALSLSCDYLKLSAENVTFCLATCVEAGFPFLSSSAVFLRRLCLCQCILTSCLTRNVSDIHYLRADGVKSQEFVNGCHARSIACPSQRTPNSCRVLSLPQSTEFPLIRSSTPDHDVPVVREGQLVRVLQVRILRKRQAKNLGE